MTRFISIVERTTLSRYFPRREGGVTRSSSSEGSLPAAQLETDLDAGLFLHVHLLLVLQNSVPPPWQASGITSNETLRLETKMKD